MSEFPDVPLGLVTELYIDGGWVDVSDRRLNVESIPIEQGYKDESGRCDPAQVTLYLDNQDGALTPKDPRSPWWPAIDQGLFVRVRDGAQVLAIGTASDIVPTWPSGDLSTDSDAGESFVTITANGALHRLNKQNRPLRSPLVRVVLSPGNLPHVSDYVPMEDAAGATHGASGLPAQFGATHATMAYTGLTLASDATLGGSEPLPSVSGGQDGSWNVATVGVADVWVTEFVIRIPQAPDDDAQRITIDAFATGTHARWSIRIGHESGNPVLRVTSFDGAGHTLVDAYADTSDFFGDTFYNMRIELEQDGSNINWGVNFSPIGPTDDPIYGVGGTTTGTAGRVTRLRAIVLNAPSGGVSFGHVTVHDGIAAGWLIPADIGWAGEEARDRVDRLTGEEDEPIQFVTGLSGSGLGTSSIPMGAQRSASLLELLEECADAEMAILCETRTVFGLVFRTRASRYNRPVVLTLDASPTASQIANPFAPSNDDQQLRNDVEVQRTSGAKARLRDEASIAKHGLHDDAVTLNLATDDVVLDAAGWRLHVFTFDGNRYAQVTIDLALCPTLRAAWKAIRVGDRIQIVNLPPQHPIWPAVDLIVGGWTEDPGEVSWTVTLNCWPAAPWTVAVFDESRYDSNGSTLAAGIDRDDPVLSVATSGAPGDLWTNDPSDVPFDLLLGDAEVVTATSITGSISPQTVTVIRAVNGISIAHATGASVGLADVPIIAL